MSKTIKILERLVPYLISTILCVMCVFAESNILSGIYIVGGGVWYGCGLLQERISVNKP